MDGDRERVTGPAVSASDVLDRMLDASGEPVMSPTFRCKCGVRVFTRFERVYRCNGCQQLYENEDAP